MMYSKKILAVCRLISGKKKMMTTTLDRIAMSNSVSYSKGNNGFQISGLLQELIVYSGQMDCYQHAHEALSKFLGVCVSAAQIWRLTDLYGRQLGKTHDFTECSQPMVREQQTMYVEADASMVFTRKGGWKEVKVGRLFKSSDTCFTYMKIDYKADLFQA